MFIVEFDLPAASNLPWPSFPLCERSMVESLKNLCDAGLSGCWGTLNTKVLIEGGNFAAQLPPN